jgi:hypothetical protein
MGTSTEEAPEAVPVMKRATVSTVMFGATVSSTPPAM